MGRAGLGLPSLLSSLATVALRGVSKAARASQLFGAFSHAFRLLFFTLCSGTTWWTQPTTPCPCWSLLLGHEKTRPAESLNHVRARRVRSVRCPLEALEGPGAQLSPRRTLERIQDAFGACKGGDTAQCSVQGKHCQHRFCFARGRFDADTDTDATVSICQNHIVT